MKSLKADVTKTNLQVNTNNTNNANNTNNSTTNDHYSEDRYGDKSDNFNYYDDGYKSSQRHSDDSADSLDDILYGPKPQYHSLPATNSTNATNTNTTSTRQTNKMKANSNAKVAAPVAQRKFTNNTAVPATNTSKVVVIPQKTKKLGQNLQQGTIAPPKKPVVAVNNNTASNNTAMNKTNQNTSGKNNDKKNREDDLFTDSESNDDEDDEDYEDEDDDDEDDDLISSGKKANLRKQPAPVANKTLNNAKNTTANVKNNVTDAKNTVADAKNTTAAAKNTTTTPSPKPAEKVVVANNATAMNTTVANNATNTKKNLR